MLKLCLKFRYRKEKESLGMRNIIETKDLTKVFKDTTVVNKVNISVKEGDIYGFLGPNGAGKSTTIKMI